LLGKSDVRISNSLHYKTSTFSFYREAEGLSETEIADALIIYKEIKKRFNSHNSK